MFSSRSDFPSRFRWFRAAKSPISPLPSACERRFRCLHARLPVPSLLSPALPRFGTCSGQSQRHFRCAAHPPPSSSGFQLPFLFIGPLPVFDYVTSGAGVTTADLRSLFSVPSLMQADFRSVLSPLPVLRPPRRHVVVFSSTSVFQASPRLPPHPVLHLASLPFLDSTSGGGTHEGGARDAETEQKGRRWR